MKDYEFIDRVSKLYQRYGIKSVTMDDIAHELGISKKTIYNYVTDKADLVEKVVESQTNDLNDRIDALRRENLNAIELSLKIHLIINEYLEALSPTSEFDLNKYYPEIYAKVKKIRSEKMYKGIVENIKKGIKEGLFRDDITPEIIASVLLHRSKCKDETEVEELIARFGRMRVTRELFLYHIRGICTEKGFKELEKQIEKLNFFNIK